MNIWTGLLFLDGSLPDVGLARDLASDETRAPRAAAEPATESPDREREAKAARAAIPLWRKSPGIALR